MKYRDHFETIASHPVRDDVRGTRDDEFPSVGDAARSAGAGQLGEALYRPLAAWRRFDWRLVDVARDKREDGVRWFMARGDQTTVTREAPSVHAYHPPTEASLRSPYAAHPARHRAL